MPLHRQDGSKRKKPLKYKLLEKPKVYGKMSRDEEDRRQILDDSDPTTDTDQNETGADSSSSEAEVVNNCCTSKLRL